VSDGGGPKRPKLRADTARRHSLNWLVRLRIHSSTTARRLNGGAPSPTRKPCDNAPNECRNPSYRAEHKQGHGNKPKHLTPKWHPSVQFKLQWRELKESDEAEDGTNFTCQEESDWNNHAHNAAERPGSGRPDQ
jgi:hypothetical protein